MMRLALSSAVLLLLFAFACDSSGEDAGITGRFTGPVPRLLFLEGLPPSELSLVLTEAAGIVSGNGTLSITRRNGDVSVFDFTVSGTLASPNFFLRWVAIPNDPVEDTFEGRIDSATNLVGVLRRIYQRENITVENTVLQRE